MKFFITAFGIFLFTNCGAQKLEISQIDFRAGACYGICPIFVMTILSNGNADFDAKRFNKKQGKFKSIINHSELDSLYDLIDKSGFFNLKDEYFSSSTDMPTYTLTIQLKDGKAKTIVDNGPSGPEKLKFVYSKLFALSKSQNWK